MTFVLPSTDKKNVSTSSEQGQGSENTHTLFEQLK